MDKGERKAQHTPDERETEATCKQVAQERPPLDERTYLRPTGYNLRQTKFISSDEIHYSSDEVSFVRGNCLRPARRTLRSTAEITWWAISFIQSWVVLHSSTSTRCTVNPTEYTVRPKKPTSSEGIAFVQRDAHFIRRPE